MWCTLVGLCIVVCRFLAGTEKYGVHCPFLGVGSLTALFDIECKTITASSLLIYLLLQTLFVDQDTRDTSGDSPSVVFLDWLKQ